MSLSLQVFALVNTTRRNKGGPTHNWRVWEKAEASYSDASPCTEERNWHMKVTNGAIVHAPKLSPISMHPKNDYFQSKSPHIRGHRTQGGEIYLCRWVQRCPLEYEAQKNNKHAQLNPFDHLSYHSTHIKREPFPANDNHNPTRNWTVHRKCKISENTKKRKSKYK